MLSVARQISSVLSRVRLDSRSSRSHAFPSLMPNTNLSQSIPPGVIDWYLQPSANFLSAVWYWPYISPESCVGLFKQYLSSGTFLHGYSTVWTLSSLVLSWRQHLLQPSLWTSRRHHMHPLLWLWVALLLGWLRISCQALRPLHNLSRPAYIFFHFSYACESYMSREAGVGHAYLMAIQNLSCWELPFFWPFLSPVCFNLLHRVHRRCHHVTLVRCWNSC